MIFYMTVCNSYPMTLEYAFLSWKVNLGTKACSVGKSCCSDVSGMTPGPGEFEMARNSSFPKSRTLNSSFSGEKVMG